MTKKKPTIKRPTLKDLATELKANQRRMDLHIATLYTRTDALDQRTDPMSRDVGALIKRANGVDKILEDNASAHRSKADWLENGQRAHAGVISGLERNVDQISKAIMSLQSGQLEHAHMISALEKAATAADDPKAATTNDRPDMEEERAAITRVIQALEILRSVL